MILRTRCQHCGGNLEAHPDPDHYGWDWWEIICLACGRTQYVQIRRTRQRVVA